MPNKKAMKQFNSEALILQGQKIMRVSSNENYYPLFNQIPLLTEYKFISHIPFKNNAFNGTKNNYNSYSISEIFVINTD